MDFPKKNVSLALALPICLANRNGDILPIFRAGYRGGGTEIAPNPGAPSQRLLVEKKAMKSERPT